MPEQFYTTLDWLPVITPELYVHFEAATSTEIPTIALWSLCSGSSRLSLQMTQLPFLQAVLFPVDLRYGWNLKNQHHQQLLQRANKLYKPFTTTVELRNHPWKYTSKDDQEKRQAQQLELPMLQFIAQHAIYLAKHKQKVIIEGLKASTLWSDTPLGRLRDHPTFRLYNTDMCRYSDQADGTRHLRKTRLLANMDLDTIQQHCTCKEGHMRLQGLVETIYQRRNTHTPTCTHISSVENCVATSLRIYTSIRRAASNRAKPLTHHTILP